jgi:hypothetical protein
MALPPIGTLITVEFNSTSVTLPDTVVATQTARLEFGDAGVPGTAQFIGQYALDGSEEPLYDVWWTTVLGWFFMEKVLGQGIFLDRTFNFGHKSVNWNPGSGAEVEKYDEVGNPVEFTWATAGRWTYAPIGSPTPGAGGNPIELYDEPENSQVIGVTDTVAEPTYYAGDIISVTEQ